MGRTLAILLLAVTCTAARAQEYNGPPPPKADVPYLLHAENLIETEVLEAKEEDRKNETAYVIPGASSPAKTPLAEPIFILLSENLDPRKLQLYSMDVNNGQRETVSPKNRKKQPPRPRYLTMKKLGEKLYWVEANEWLDNGEYCLTPIGSNNVYCFEVY